jgi:sodium-dependent dicarboxylate transporter 2/3/5
MGGGLCLGAVITSSGLADWLIGRMPAGGLGLFALTVLFAALACLMSSLMSNTAAANLLMPLVLGLSAAPLTPIFLGAAFACTLAMPLPISTPPNAIAFSSGSITVRDIVNPGLLITLTGLGLSLTLGYWWWGKIFDF